MNRPLFSPLIRTTAVLALLITLACLTTPPPALALDPARQLAQFKETDWSVDRGAPPDIGAMIQSPSGFLWLATSSGLYRFDGVTFEHIPSIAGDRTRSKEIVSLLAARDGAIWVGHLWGGLSVYRNGVMRDANHGPPTGRVVEILQAQDGAIWVGTRGVRGAQISRLKSGRWTDAGVSFGLPEGDLHDMTFARDGALWVLSDQFVAVLRPGGQRFVSRPIGMGGLTLVEDSAGRVWSTGLNGVRALSSSSASFSGAAGIASSVRYSSCVTFDHDGNLFACRPDGSLGVIHPEGFAANTPKTSLAGQSADAIHVSTGQPLSLLEDREGNLWVGASSGLTQIRSTNIVLDPFRTAGNDLGPRMITAADGKVYFGEANDLEQTGPDGAFRSVGQVGAPSDQIVALCADREGGVWATLLRSIHHWREGHQTSLQPPAAWGGQPPTECAVDGGGDLWVAVSRKGLFRQHAGAWTRVELDASRPGLWPVYLTADKQGRILAYVGLGKLYRLSGATVEQLGSTADFGVGFLRTVYPRQTDILAGGEDGLVRYDGRRVQVISSDRWPWLSTVSGIVQTPAGDTWLNGAEGVVRVRTNDLEDAFSRPDRPIPYELFDSSDGVQGSVLNLQNFEGALGADGRVWFQTSAGRIWIDPARLHRNSILPPVVIRSVIADHHAYAAGDDLVLPPGVRSLQFDYTALSLTAPDRVRFRYRLHGVDKDWVDSGGRRQAFYTNLNPGVYRFDVIAANNDGVWNNTGASVALSIEPAFWQSPVFTAVVVLVALALLWLLYSVRLRQMSRRMQLRLEDRLGERERIARELHDTLLQGFQGLTMRFQAVADQIPPTEPARKLLEQALDRADEVLVEGRDRVKSLRGNDAQGDLAYRIEAAAYQLRLDPEVEISVLATGDCRLVHPVVCDELLAIATEALFNAFKHACAKRIDIGLACERHRVRLSIADDGVGIDRSILEAAGRAGHYGFVGMRERARKLKARLLIHNRAKGAEVLLLVPGRVAYARSDRRFALFNRTGELES